VSRGWSERSGTGRSVRGSMSSGECPAAIGVGTAGFLAERKSTATIIESRSDVVCNIEPVERLTNPPHV
jgi:hypothetical protein